MKITFGRVSDDGWERRVTVFLDGEEIGELYRGEGMSEWAASSMELDGYDGDPYVAESNLARAKKAVAESIREILEGRE